MLQLVHRPTIRHVVQSLFRRNLVPVEHCVAKIKQNFSAGHVASQIPLTGTSNPSSSSGPTGEKENIDQTSLKVFLSSLIRCFLSKSGNNYILFDRFH